jgi:hypothetical protein
MAAAPIPMAAQPAPIYLAAETISTSIMCS